jgi:NAD(P)-dependent dehydrogenase (short-subunit alcohol dehydrogenase family)
VVLVTGGSSGIGLAAAIKFAAGRRHHGHLRRATQDKLAEAAQIEPRRRQGARQRAHLQRATSPTMAGCRRASCRRWKPSTAASTS